MRIPFICLLSVLGAYSTCVQAAQSQAAERNIEVTVTNITQGIYFARLIALAHTPETSLFTVGKAASAAIADMAEGGRIEMLQDIATSIGANVLFNPAGGQLPPGQKTSGQLMTTGGNTRLSIVGMMLPTNDGFVGLNSWRIPTEPGTYTVSLNAYDSGTEANDELRGSGVLGMPGMPVPANLSPEIGKNGTGIPGAVAEGFVHIHRGNLGDLDPDGGVSDIRADRHRWLNPIARVTVVVK